MRNRNRWPDDYPCHRVHTRIWTGREKPSKNPPVGSTGWCNLSSVVKTKQLFHLGRFWFVSIFLWGALAVAQEGQSPKPTPAPAIKFRPVKAGAASVRVTGGSRGTGADTVVLDVLTPDEVGITTQEQPSLFWFQSKPANARFELTLLQEKQVKPLVQVQIERSTKAGIQRLKLADHGAKLVPGVEYQWVVALVTDPENRSTDLVASGAIKRIEPTVELRDKIKKADPTALPGIYAEAGIWYDALSALSDQIDANPAAENLRETRRELLRQVGLKAAAAKH